MFCTPWSNMLDVIISGQEVVITWIATRGLESLWTWRQCLKVGT